MLLEINFNFENDAGMPHRRNSPAALCTAGKIAFVQIDFADMERGGNDSGDMRVLQILKKSIDGLNVSINAD